MRPSNWRGLVFSQAGRRREHVQRLKLNGLHPRKAVPIVLAEVLEPENEEDKECPRLQALGLQKIPPCPRGTICHTIPHLPQRSCTSIPQVATLCPNPTLKATGGGLQLGKQPALHPNPYPPLYQMPLSSCFT